MVLTGTEGEGTRPGYKSKEFPHVGGAIGWATSICALAATAVPHS